MEENVVLNAISELNNNVNKMATNLNELNGTVNGLKDEVNGLKENFNELKGDFNELKGDFNELKGDFNEFKKVSNTRFDLLELGQKELRHEVKALRAKHEVLEIEIKQELKDTKEELIEEIHKVDNRVAGLEKFVGRYTQIVANKFEAVENDNTKEHDEFKEALKFAN